MEMEEQKNMQTNPNRLILSALLIAAVACAGLAGTGCKTDNRASDTRQGDKQAASRIKKALKDAPAYKLEEVRVEVYDGVAQLSGFTDTKEQKVYAGEIAADTSGVRQVINNIAMKPAESVTPTGYGNGRQYPAPPGTVNQAPVNTIQAPSTSYPQTGTQSTKPATQSVPSTPSTPSNQKNLDGLGSPNRQNENISSPNQP